MEKLSSTVLLTRDWPKKYAEWRRNLPWYVLQDPEFVEHESYEVGEDVKERYEQHRLSEDDAVKFARSYLPFAMCPVPGCHAKFMTRGDIAHHLMHGTFVRPKLESNNTLGTTAADLPSTASQPMIFSKGTPAMDVTKSSSSAVPKPGPTFPSTGGLRLPNSSAAPKARPARSTTLKRRYSKKPSKRQRPNNSRDDDYVDSSTSSTDTLSDENANSSARPAKRRKTRG